MARRTLIMTLLKGISQGGQVLTERILHGSDGGNKPLYSFMNGLYVIMGKTHSRGYFSEADLGKMTSNIILSLGSGITDFFSSYQGTTYNVLQYLPCCTSLDCHGVDSLTAQDVSCQGMAAVKEIRFDDTAIRNIDVKDLANLQSIRYSENATEITLDGNTSLGINIL